MTVAQRLSQISHLPTLPEVMLQVQEIVSSGDGSASALAGVIRQDPALTAKIMKVANSAFYGAAGTTMYSIDRAVARIGFNEVRNITTAVTLIHQFSRKDRLLDHRGFWRHSVCAALLAQDIPSRQAMGLDRDQLFLAGLLHDIGILVYDQYFHDEFQRMVIHCREQMLPYASAEQVLAKGDTHGHVGAALLARWKIDDSVATAVLHHHTPGGVSDGPQGALVRAIAAVEVVVCNTEDEPFEGKLLEPVGGLMAQVFGPQSQNGAYTDLLARSREKTELILSE